MTYLYLLSLPLLSIYVIGNAVIKYKEGFMAVPGHGIVPVPWQLWRPAFQQAIFPLMMMFAFSWSLEISTHLAELCFWLFLIKANSSQQDWFKSIYFKIWAIGSVVAFYIPLVTILTRTDPLNSEACTFFAGSLGSLSVTLWFIPVLWTFPSFLRSLEEQGVDEAAIVRLTTFNEFNRIRVAFRLVFFVPILILGIDGLQPHHHINENPFGTDFLAMTAGFGCVISSALTLIIFFPRSISTEYKAKKAKRVEHEKQSRYSHRLTQTQTRDESPMFVLSMMSFSPADRDDCEEDVTNVYEEPPVYSQHKTASDPFTHGESAHTKVGWVPSISDTHSEIPLRPNRRDEEAAIQSDGRRSSGSPTSKKWVHPLLKSFRSPIDLLGGRLRG